MKRTIKGLQEENNKLKEKLKVKEAEIAKLKNQYENMSNATYQTASDNKDLKSHWTFKLRNLLKW